MDVIPSVSSMLSLSVVLAPYQKVLFDFFFPSPSLFYLGGRFRKSLLMLPWYATVSAALHCSLWPEVLQN